jgi:predicted transcriptional regulator
MAEEMAVANAQAMIEAAHEMIAEGQIEKEQRSESLREGLDSLVYNRPFNKFLIRS